MPRTVVSAVAWFVAAAGAVASWCSSCGECGSASPAARRAASAARAGLAPGTAPDGAGVPDGVGAALEGLVLDGAGGPAGAVAVPDPVVPPPWVAGTVAVAIVPTRAGCAVGAGAALNPDETTRMAAAEPPAMKRTASAAAAATAAPHA